MVGIGTTGGNGMTSLGRDEDRWMNGQITGAGPTGGGGATTWAEGGCYDPPPFFPPLSDPLLITLPSKPVAKRPLPLNPSVLPDLPPLPPSKPSKPSSPLDQPPVLPLVPVPWNIYRQDYSSMEMYQEPPPVENPLEDPDSPMEDVPPLEPEPVTQTMNPTLLEVTPRPYPLKSPPLNHGKSTLLNPAALCPASTPYHPQVPLQRPYNNAPVVKAVISQLCLQPHCP